MKTLELKDICSYLSGRILGKHPEGDICWIDLAFVAKHGIGLCNYRPILRPISDLAKEITHKGEKFVPIVELAKIAYGGKGEWGQPIYSGEVYQCFCNGLFYGYEPQYCSFIVCGMAGEPVFSPMQRDLFDKLSEWMFDYRGLISSGLAVDVNTLSINPYEK